MRWKEERASNRSEIVKVDGLSKLTNGVVFVFGCVYVCVAILGLGILAFFFASFTPAVGSLLWPLFCLKSWNPDKLSLWNKNMLKYWIILNYDILYSYSKILQFLGKSFATFTPSVGSLAAFLPEIMLLLGRYSSLVWFKELCQFWNMKLLKKTNKKNSQIWGKLLRQNIKVNFGHIECFINNININ